MFFGFRFGFNIVTALLLPLALMAEQTNPSYVLGPEDQVTIRVVGVPEIGERPIRIGLDGNIELSYVGRVRASGLTVDELKELVTTRLKTVVREPEVSVGIE